MIYVNHSFTSLFIINLKCGYSSFESLVNQQQLYRVYFDENEYQDYAGNMHPFSPNNARFYATLRNPLHRVLSFYNNKFVSCFNGHQDAADQQDCQKAIYQFYPERKIRDLEFKFSDLVEAMRCGYDDVHLNPQGQLIKYFGPDRVTILNMDRADFNDRCAQLLGFYLPRSNRSVSRERIDDYTRFEDISANDLNYLTERYQEDLSLYQAQ